jgi:uncharacterized membrane protein
MAISIQIPNLPENLTQTQLLERLMDLRSHFEIYALSFFIIGIYWIAYHQILGHIARTHGTMIWLNLGFLFFITLISFAVDLQVDYGFFPIVFSIYALVLIFAGSLLAIIWFHAKKNELIDSSLQICNSECFLTSHSSSSSVFNFDPDFSCECSDCLLLLVDRDTS